MILPDVNVLVYAHKTGTAGHEQYPDWPVAELDGPVHPGTTVVGPGPRSRQVFAALVEDAQSRSNLVPDAYHAALAMEHGCEWITTDRDYARFTGLRWRHPLDAR